MPTVCSRRALLTQAGLALAAPTLTSPLLAIPTPARASTEAPLRVLYPHIDERPAEAYGYQVLRLALERSGEPHRLAVAAQRGSSRMAMQALQRGQLDIVDAGLSRWMSDPFDYLPFPIDQGLAGCRLLLCRRDTVARLDALHSLPAMASLVIGQGLGWPDVHVLRNAGLQVVEGDFPSLWRMLQNGRFDVLPLGAEEAHELLRKHQAEAPDVLIHPGVGLFYPFPRVFFFTRGNERLKAALHRGLEAAQADGALRELQLRSPGLGPLLSGQRRLPAQLVPLPNPGWPAAQPYLPLDRYHPALRAAMLQLMEAPAAGRRR